MSKKARVAIIGAGMSGLACAYELSKQGHQVVVYEAQEGVGGRASTRRIGGYPFDLGAQFLNNGYQQARRYCEELNIEAQWRTLSPSTHHLYHDNKLHCISFSSIREFLGLSFYSRIARLRLLMCYMRLQKEAQGLDLYDLCSANSKLDQVSAKDYVLRWGGKEVLEYAFDSLIATYHFHGAEDLSLSCLLGAIAVIGPNFSYDFLNDGMDILAQALAKQVEVRTSTAVEAVTNTSAGVAVESQKGREVFDKAVIATTASTAKKILYSPSDLQKGFLDAVRFSATINAGFRVPSAPIAKVAMVAVPYSQNGCICCYFNQNSKYPWRLEGGQTVVNVFLRDECAREQMLKSDDEVWDFMQHQFLKVCPPLADHSARIFRHDLQRWPEAIPKYSTSFVPLATRFWSQGQGDHDIYLCGDYLNAPWLEGSLRCGKKVADLIASR